MLPAAQRLNSPPDFRQTVRRGVRVGRRTLVVHALVGEIPPTRVGFVVSKAVGNAVVRNRVKRRLRHLAASRLPDTPTTALVVVRALPTAATRPESVAEDFTSAWDEAFERLAVAA